MKLKSVAFINEKEKEKINTIKTLARLILAHHIPCA